MQCHVESCKSLQSSASLAIYLRSDMLRNQDEGSRRSLPAVDTGSIFCCNAASRDFCLPPPLWRPKCLITVLYGPQKPDDSYTASLNAIGTILRSRQYWKFVYDIRTGVGSGFGAIGEIGSCAAIALTARGEPLSLRYSASRGLINPGMCNGKSMRSKRLNCAVQGIIRINNMAWRPQVRPQVRAKTQEASQAASAYHRVRSLVNCGTVFSCQGRLHGVCNCRRTRCFDRPLRSLRP